MTTRATTRRAAARELEAVRAALGEFCRPDQRVSDAVARVVMTLRDAVETMADVHEDLRKVREELNVGRRVS